MDANVFGTSLIRSVTVSEAELKTYSEAVANAKANNTEVP